MYQKVNNLAQECLTCINKPCTKGCPLENDITSAIKLVKDGMIKEAYETFASTTVLSGICGRVCPHTSQCQGKCIKGIKANPVEIGQIEAYLADEAIHNDWKIPMLSNNVIDKKVAIIGGGPSGITCAAFLKREGVKEVTIYEKYNFLGGIMMHSIPDFRLDKKVLEDNINKILELGINVELEKELGKDITLEDLEKEYDAIFLSFGANLSTKMGIAGEELNGVYGGNELLEFKNYPDFTDKNVAVIGGGNVAMDVARSVNKLNPKSVTVIYRRSEKEMPAELKEIEEAKKEGIEFLFQTNILQILGDEKVEKVECIKTELIQKEGDTRLSPVNIEGSEYLKDMDYVIMALGSKADNNLLDKLDLELTSRGKIKVDENGKTSKSKVYAGGDIIGAGTIAWAAKQGRDAAYEILNKLRQES